VAKLLVIDDEPGVRYSLGRVFAAGEVEVVSTGTAREGMEALDQVRPDVILLDLQLPDRNGLDVFDEIQRRDPRRPVIFITAHGTTNTAIEAMKRGAFDYLVKPVDVERVLTVVGRAIEASRLMNVPAVLPTELEGDRLLGRSSVMQEMGNLLGRVAPQDVNVLILGESGVGKELVARALYQHSRRATRPFLAINCAAIPENLLESELFGHEVGAFTGADRRRIGKFEQCDGGTLFLDEIGDMAPPLQAKILRVLQEQQFERVGGSQTVRTSVRILAATNQNLEAEVEAGRFRKDLYYRLRVVTVQVPPLRERSEDIAELAHHFLFRFNRELGLNLRGFTPETLAFLEQHTWPGNVRELQSVLKEAMLRANGPMVSAEVLPESMRRDREIALKPEVGLEAFIETALREGTPNLHEHTIQHVERILFTLVLKHTHGHQSQAAELLGLNRSTLRTHLKELKISLEKFPISDSMAE